ncbi:MAG: hypothetical protein WC607_00760 [Candidatus Micrarchaeia archaeon]
MNAKIVLAGGRTRAEFKRDLEEYGQLNKLFFACQPGVTDAVTRDLKTLGVPANNFFEPRIDVFADGEKRFSVSHADAARLARAAANPKARFVILLGTRPFKQAEDYLDAFLTLESFHPLLPAKRTLAVCVYAAYLRSHRKTPGAHGAHAFASEPLVAHVLVDALLSSPFGSRYAAVAPHTSERGVVPHLAKGFYPLPIFLQAFKAEFGEGELSLFAPDEEAAIAMRREFRKAMGSKARLAYVKKARGEKADETRAEAFVGNVRGTNVLCIDDLTSTGNSLARTVDKAREQGALKIMVAVTHVTTVKALVRILESKADRIAFTNSIDLDYLLSTDAQLAGKARRLIAQNARSGRLLYLSVAPTVLRGAVRALSKAAR